MDYICYKQFLGKNLLNEPVIIPIGGLIEERGNILYYANKPVCINRSQVAKDFFVWDGDGNASKRFEYETYIINREVAWQENYKNINPETNEEYIETIEFTDRFLPEEMEYINKNYPQFINQDTGMFSDFFYRGSNIDDIKNLVDYLKRNIN